MSGIFPQGGLSQAYTALTRLAGLDRNAAKTGSGSGFAAQIDQTEKNAFDADETLTAQSRPLTKDDGFKEYFVASSTSFDPNAPRGSYVNIVV